ncbi:aminoacyl-histidine dipeptidase [Blattamonas nauphoetae]|uniref:Aminoacyl-histidine dipeptidase n=1 Tax=Blattamonas nauphoetae TaxID=2049346 RepID=A0ABQ9X7A7_9EUKA|nr:aminoacyl-histidine dipeptidase [Blattamonas nauphoetae]
MTKYFKLPQHEALYNDPRLPEPKAIWNFMFFLAEIPRGSGNCKEIARRLQELGQQWGYESFIDTIGNVIIRKPASPGLENKSMVTLQAHMDIVAVGEDGLDHNFEKDPVICRIAESNFPKHSKNSLFATGTSLGADDGIGCAMMLHILEDKTLKHGPLECVFTYDEETTMEGAVKMVPGTLKGKYLINIDSEEDFRITIGCAGGFEQIMTFDVERENTEGFGSMFEIKGLQGGHSGVEIHEGRANAVKLLARLVHEASLAADMPEPVLMGFEGGTKRNVIPSVARCRVLIPDDKRAKFTEAVNKEFKQIKHEWKTIEPDLTLNFMIPEAAEKVSALTKASSRKFLDLLLALPHGVLRYSPDVAGLVETSINMAIVHVCGRCVGEKARIELFPRSSVNEFMPHIHQQLKAFARLAGAELTPMENAFPGWEPNPSSPLLATAKECYKKVYGKEAEIYAIHAGLECGVLQEKHPGLQSISVGPYLKNVHSPKEELMLDTVPGINKLIIAILEAIE